jgi:hypothetical protein
MNHNAASTIWAARIAHVTRGARAIVLGRMTLLPYLVAFVLSQTSAATRAIEFRAAAAGEAVATIAAGCARCDWSVDGREAVLLELAIDGRYSQHLALTRGESPAEYTVMLGAVGAGTHRLSIARDARRSAAGTGDVTFGRIDVKVFDPASPEYPWLARAPILRARPGTVEKFSDFPLVMYAERDVSGESGSRYQVQYTVIFTNEDGGTPTDRLMATWGRTTDIEFIYGLTEPPTGEAAREEIQSAGHKWIPFQGPREGPHPILWVATENNMVADHGADDLVRFAPAPQLVSLAGTSREKVMDDNPWMYAVTSAEMVREHRVDPGATPGSGRIVDPRRYVTIEACGQVKDATLAFDVGVKTGGDLVWLPTDTDPRFRIARGGCFRGGAPAPAGVTGADVAGLRIRAYARPAREGEPAPPAGSVVLERVTKVFMLDRSFVPAVLPLSWIGVLPVKTDSSPVAIPLRH